MFAYERRPPLGRVDRVTRVPNRHGLSSGKGDKERLPDAKARVYREMSHRERQMRCGAFNFCQREASTQLGADEGETADNKEWPLGNKDQEEQLLRTGRDLVETFHHGSGIHRGRRSCRQ
uniref:Uncharacterized protein n=1 Tax=Trichuris muris TaxID=70415 RepID=A0A5S6QFK0_TRIMR